MEAIFVTTVGQLAEHTNKRIKELNHLIDENREFILKSANSAKSYEDVIKLIQSNINSGLTKDLKIYQENLEYINECKPEQEVRLNQTEWRHYFNATQRPEWC